MLLELSEILGFFAGGTLGLGKSSPLGSFETKKKKRIRSLIWSKTSEKFPILPLFCSSYSQY